MCAWELEVIMNRLSQSHLRSILRCRWPGFVVVAVFCLVAGTFERPAQGANATLADLFNGGVLDVGNVRFSDWQLTSLDATATPPDLALITIVPLVDDPQNPGVQIVANGQLAITGLNSIDLLFSFRASPLGGSPLITGHSLELLGVTGNSGIAFVSEELADGLGGDLGPALVIADNTSSFFQLVDGGSFPPQSGVVVTANVFLNGVSDADAIGIGSFSQRFSQVPEPGTILLALLALPAVACVRRRR